MSLFQNSVLNKYLKGLEAKQVEQAWNTYTAHFHNPEIQENIRNSKEEQYQEGFLRDLFVNIFGYILNPESNFNLTTELKNLKGAKKTDGAILSRDLSPLGNKVLAVIELKGTNTVDLAKVETQAFGYKNNQPGCTYVITSNFEKLRFYIDNAVDCEEFNLFRLNRKRFELLYLCLASENLLKGIPKRIKDESLIQEERVTKKLYKDYSQFRNEIFNNILQNNSVGLNPLDKLTLFKKTQKLLDRFLFIFFAEDRLLLPPNSIRDIVNQWTTLRDELDAYVPLYDRFKKYFGYMNTGYKGKRHDIFAYNGGLFEPDELLDNITIDDQPLYKHTLNLSNYDFESEVSVNILGHIFEHSLTEIENIQAQLEGTEIDKSKTKRKKDGVFYTPKYITKYIVDNTIGKLCEEKKGVLAIDESDYKKPRRRRRKAIVEALRIKLDDYRKWLLSLTICDPACGSGAFLNQALEYLIAEHGYIDELKFALLGESLKLSNIENSILENNLFGVDINEESVDIAKLSLWLRTAKKGRKLTTLNNNIKCGNSLIDDPEVAGDKAFDWYKEFPTVFQEQEKQAFHVVLTTHNSRTSQRMVDLGIKKGAPIELALQEEIELTEIFKQIIKDNHYNCLAYNICKDHVHLILVCEKEELTGIVQKLKSVSSKLFHRLDIPMGHDPLEHGNHLWSQKFFRADLDVWQLATLSHKPGYLYKETHLGNAIHYIRHNREKHQLPTSQRLQKLIDDFVVDQDHAFRPEYIGGFDVVIGNPPYVKRQNLSNQKEIEFLDENYVSATYNFDLYLLFIEQGSKLIKGSGLLSFINPSKFTSTKTGEGIRKYLSQSCHIIDFVNFKEYQVFDDATTYCCIITIQNGKFLITNFLEINESSPNEISTYRKYKFQIEPSQSGLGWNLKPSIKITGDFNLDRIVNTFTGIESGADNIYILPSDSSLISSFLKYKNEIVFPTLKGSNLHRYYFKPEPYFSIVPYKGRELISNDNLITNYPEIVEYLNQHIEEIKGRENGKMNHANWYGYVYPKNLYKYENNRLIWTDISIRPQFVIDKSQNWHVRTVCSLELNNNDLSKSISLEFLQGVLNSNLFFYFIKSNSNAIRGGYYRYKPQYVKQFPIVSSNNTLQEKISKLSLQQQSNTEELFNQRTKFLNRVQDNLGIEKLSKKMKAFYDHDFKIFVTEISKGLKSLGKGKFSLSDQDEWEEYFTQYKNGINQLQSQIQKTDNEIDLMVYQLYGLTDEEIKIVESS